MIWKVGSNVYIQFRSLGRKLPSVLLLLNNNIYMDNTYKEKSAGRIEGRLLATKELTIWVD